MTLRKVWPLSRAQLPPGVGHASEGYLMEARVQSGLGVPEAMRMVGGPLLLAPRSALGSRLPMRGTHFSPSELLRDDFSGFLWRRCGDFSGEYVWVLMCDKPGNGIRSVLPQLTESTALTYEQRMALASTLFCSRSVLRPGGELRGLYV